MSKKPTYAELEERIQELEKAEFDRKKFGEELRAGMEALRQLNESLEQRVAERTKLAEARAKQLRALAAELTFAEKRERQRLAEILHDHLQQLLVGAKINSEVLSVSIGKEHKQMAENVLNLINQSLQTSRSLTTELSHPVLKEGRLSGALEWLARRMRKIYGLSVELHTDSSMDPGNEEITILLFRAIRELLFNVVKHAGVKSVRIEMFRHQKDWLCVNVIDQGTGFDPATILIKASRGFGLFSIRERLELMGGRLEIRSSPGNGAAFALFVPLQKTRNKEERRIEKIIAEIRKAKKRGDKIRVLLVDDHTVVRQGLSTMLNLHLDIDIVSEAADGDEAVEKARQLHPDVILMDIGMPGMNGVEATRIIHSEFPEIRVIGLSMYDKDDQAFEMLKAGAAAYCTKDGASDELLAAIRGEAVAGPAK